MYVRELDIASATVVSMLLARRLVVCVCVCVCMFLLFVCVHEYVLWLLFGVCVPLCMRVCACMRSCACLHGVYRCMCVCRCESSLNLKSLVVWFLTAVTFEAVL